MEELWHARIRTNIPHTVVLCRIEFSSVDVSDSSIPAISMERILFRKLPYLFATGLPSIHIEWYWISSFFLLPYPLKDFPLRLLSVILFSSCPNQMNFFFFQSRLEWSFRFSFVARSNYFLHLVNEVHCIFFLNNP